MSKISVIIPVYNEEAGIGPVLDELKEVLKGHESEIIVVDDGSTDNTAGKVMERKAKMIRHAQNRGYGAAIVTGIKNAANDLILIIDGDGSYPVKDVPRLLEYAGQYDMVVGSRTGKSVQVQPYRKPAKWFLSKLANYLSGTRIPDLNSGMRIFRKNDVEKFFNILPAGFSLTTTITLAYLSDNHSVKYVPIDYHKRKGDSKIRPFSDGFNFILLILRAIMYFNPLKVFIPLSVILFFAALLVFFYSWLVLGRVMDISTVLLGLASVQVLVLGLIADLITRRTR